MSARRIGVVGSCMTDLVIRADRMPGAGETLAAESFSVGAGGKGANQAVAAARLGAEVMLVARVGEDAFGGETRAGLARAGIDIRHVAAVPGASGVATILVEPSGENRILIARGANDRLRPQDVDAAEDDLKACALILLQLEVPLETVYRTVALAARHGVPVLLNPAPAEPALDLARIASAAFFVPNQTELALVTGLPAGTPAEAEAAARWLIARGLRTVIVTLGAQGALFACGDAPALHVPAPRAVARDTTGAGDAFVGAFAQAWAVDRDAPNAMRRAVAYAADAVTREGAQAAFAEAGELTRILRAQARSGTISA